jgi:protoheme IX farnesyltransferase
LDDDYRKAGFELLPSPGGRDKSSAFQAFVYSFSLVPAGIMPYVFHMSGVPSLLVITLMGLSFAYLAWQLYRHCTTDKARKLMFGSFIYLPIVQLALVLDKI